MDEKKFQKWCKDNPFKDYADSQESYYTPNELAFAEFLENLSEIPETKKKQIRMNRIMTLAQAAVGIGILVGVKYLEAKYK